MISWAFLAVASILVRNVWQDRARSGTASRLRECWRSWQFGQSSKRARLRERLLEANPILWLAGRYRLKRVLVLVSLGAFGVSWSLLAWKYPRGMLDPSVYLLSAYVAQTMLKLWVASEAVLLFGEDRRTGALELVLSTPLKVEAICDGQIQALERQFGWPVMIVLCLDLAMFVASSMEQIPILLSLGIMIVFVTDLYTLAWVGLWLGLTAKLTNRALRGADWSRARVALGDFSRRLVSVRHKPDF